MNQMNWSIAIALIVSALVLGIFIGFKINEDYHNSIPPKVEYIKCDYIGLFDTVLQTGTGLFVIPEKQKQIFCYLDKNYNGPYTNITNSTKSD